MYAAIVNRFRILCPDGTHREPCPREVAALVRTCARVSLDGTAPRSSAAVRAAERAAERAGDLADAIHLSRRLDRLGIVAHARRIVSDTVQELTRPII